MGEPMVELHVYLTSGHVVVSEPLEEEHVPVLGLIVEKGLTFTTKEGNFFQVQIPHTVAIESVEVKP